MASIKTHSVKERGRSIFLGSLRYKLIFLIAVTLSLAMFVASLFFVLYDRDEAEKNLHESIFAIANITAERSVTAMAFMDKNTVGQNLNALLTVEKIRLACLYDKKGELFSSAVNTHFNSPHCLPDVNSMQSLLEDDGGYLTVQLPVARKSTVYGELFIIADLSHLYGRMLNIIGASLVVSLLSSLISYVLTIKLQYSLIKPIASLSHVADRVSHTQDYSIRAQRMSNDEVGQLVDSFNGMLGRIEGGQERLHDMVDELEEQSVRLKHHAKDSEVQREEVQEMLAAASHDLKQPLQAMTMFIAALRGEPEKSDVLIDKLERSIKNMKQLFIDLMDVSSLEKRIKTTSQQDSVYIPDLFDHLYSEYNVVAENKGLTLDVRKLDCTIGTYAFTLQRIIRNLLSNALRYTQEGGIILACRMKQHSILIEVWDTGVGIPKNEINDVFKEFVQVNPGQRSSLKGVGLGLSIVKRCCDLLDYKIEVKSRYGRGSVFRLCIPRDKILDNGANQDIALQGYSDQHDMLAPPISSYLNRLAGKRVLLIDDDPVVRDAMAALFYTWNIEVNTFETMASCMEYIVSQSKYAPDIIVSDYQLGAKEFGTDLIEKIRDYYAMDVPALLITGLQDDNKINALKSKGFYLLHKPVKPGKLRALMESLINANISNSVV